ncbi:MAG TPA: CoA-binding protein [Peptococcaceae bacterium]|nr:CoA-binding protein [Peptococcaceae bacterium]
MEKRKKVYKIIDQIDTSMNFAVLANADRLKKHRHAWKVWRTLQDFGCKVYVVAPDLDKFEGRKLYSDLQSIPGQVDVVVPCLRPEFLEGFIEAAAAKQCKYIWFQEKNWTPEFAAQAEEKGIGVVRGCVLKHIIFKKPLAFFNPCYWHGRGFLKVPNKYR